MSAAEPESFERLVALEPESTDVLLGHSPNFKYVGVFGGLAVAQALRAALTTTPPDRQLHSLHAYFIRGGDPEQAIRYEVERERDGRSFTTRHVVARQSDGPILDMTASFQREEQEVTVQTLRMPADLPDPESLTQAKHAPWLLERRDLPFDPERPGYLGAWMRVPSCPSNDPVLQICAFAYQSDELPSLVPHRIHPSYGTPKPRIGQAGISLDHAVWIHRPMRADRWIYHEAECHQLGNARGLTILRMWNPEGEHVATVAQESLVRTRPDD